MGEEEPATGPDLAETRTSSALGTGAGLSDGTRVPVSMTGMVVDTGDALQHQRHPRQGPQIRVEAVGPRPQP